MGTHALGSTRLLAALVMVVSAALARVDVALAQQPTVTTGDTTYLGVGSPLFPDEVERFLGVQYAQAPIGDLRFRAPRRFVPSEDTTDATQFGHACPQPREVALATQAEDCLHLDIFRRVGTTADDRKPVGVFIHGGAFDTGHSSEQPGDDLAQYGDIIYISATYRLGTLGFLHHEVLDRNSDSGTSGNYGLLDIISVLDWVQDNVHFFGGDPNSVTLQGQSAGAVGIGFLPAVPEAEGLFHRMIFESYGPPLTGSREPALGPLYWNAEKQRTVSDLTIDLMGCRPNANETDEEVLDCIRRVPFEDLIRFSDNTQWADLYPANLIVDHHVWGPTADGQVVKDDVLTLFQRGEFFRVPMMAGTNAQEGNEFTPIELLLNGTFEDMRRKLQIDFPKMYNEVFDFYRTLQPVDLPPFFPLTPGYLYAQASITDQYLTCTMRRGLDMMRDIKGETQLYSFVFNHLSSWRLNGTGGDPALQVPHTSELPYIFGPLEGIHELELANEEELQLHRDMLSYVTNFIKFGDPMFDDRGQVEWPPFGDERKSLVFQTEGDGGIKVITGFKKTECDFWDDHTPVTASATSTTSSPSVNVTAIAIVFGILTCVLLTILAWYGFRMRQRWRKTSEAREPLRAADEREPAVVAGARGSVSEMPARQGSYQPIGKDDSEIF